MIKTQFFDQKQQRNAKEYIAKAAFWTRSCLVAIWPLTYDVTCFKLQTRETEKEPG